MSLMFHPETNQSHVICSWVQGRAAQNAKKADVGNAALQALATSCSPVILIVLVGYYDAKIMQSGIITS